MNTCAAWLADKLSLALEPHERDALRGDHAELGVTGTQALRDVLGLVELQVGHGLEQRELLQHACEIGQYLAIVGCSLVERGDAMRGLVDPS